MREAQRAGEESAEERRGGAKWRCGQHPASRSGGSGGDAGLGRRSAKKSEAVDHKGDSTHVRRGCSDPSGTERQA